MQASWTRPAWVKVRGQDLNGKEITMEGTGLLARAFCHEIDHLDGTLFIERLGVFKARSAQAETPETNSTRRVVNDKR